MDSIRKQPPLAHMDDYDDLKLPTTSSKQNCKEMHCHVILNGDDHNDVEEAAGLTSNELIQLKKRKSLFMRLWKYLKHSLTGVIAGNGKKLFTEVAWLERKSSEMHPRNDMKVAC